MSTGVVIAYAIFAGYFALIALSFALVFISIGTQRPPEALLETKPFAFLRAALGALICTWYFMFQFMKWSYLNYREHHAESTLGDWLENTSLFDQAWSVVCIGDANWWWSSWICTAAVFLAAGIWYQSAQRSIRFPWAYMLLGQLVAISVATGLFLVAVFMHDKRPVRPKAPFAFWLLLVTALVIEAIMPRYAGTSAFLPALGVIHLGVFLPLFFVPTEAVGEQRSPGALSFRTLTALLAVISVVIHYSTTKRVLEDLKPGQSFFKLMGNTVLTHPAQGSISLDVVWVGIIALLLFLVSGSMTSVIIKFGFLAACAAVAGARYLGINWLLIASCIPVIGLFAVGVLAIGLSYVRKRNSAHRAATLDRLGIKEHGIIAGTTTEPPRMASRRLVAGFWHPYCNAGGGGERVLWTAIAWLQREDPEVVILVYSGDYPAASKVAILSKVKERFSIVISPDTLEFIPLPSRHLISDTYWSRFTLLGQSLGSLYVAWEGLCGKNGMWGDIFIDSMGYGFVLPFVRFIAGGSVAIGTYTHYPTVSSDMVKRVRERSAEGVENGGVASSAWRTRAKLVYYSIFTRLYALALLFSDHTMTNSSWTQAHIKSLRTSARSSFAASILLKDEAADVARESRGESTKADRAVCEVVYPPCDTRELSKLGNLTNRARELVSLAQFRPEKEHAKQLHALSALLKKYPEYGTDAKWVHLTLMGGSRNAGDEARVASLRALAKELDIEEHISFLVNAPYPDIVKELGTASIGLNTMQDEHFGINIVEFMAAGLIPIVHASAGPLMDIVVPYNGQKTGFHATDAESFADAIHEALSLSPEQDLTMRKAARALAEDRFSEAAFEKGFERGWERLVHRAEDMMVPEESEKY